MSFWSTFYGVEVRAEIAKEFTDETGHIDDMMAGLHEIRARMVEQDALREHVQHPRMKPQRKHLHVKRLSPKHRKKEQPARDNHILA